MHLSFSFFFFNDTATTEIYTLSLHDALPISETWESPSSQPDFSRSLVSGRADSCGARSEEHTSELQSPCNLVCRLLLEKKKQSSLTSHSRRTITTSSHELNPLFSLHVSMYDI